MRHAEFNPVRAEMMESVLGYIPGPVPVPAGARMEIWS